MHCFGVFDGHSIGGDFAAAAATKSFDKHLAKRVTSLSVDDKTIAAVYKSVHSDILALYDNVPAAVSYPAPTANKLVKWSLRKAGQMQFYSYGGKYDRPIEFGTTAVVLLLVEATKELIVSWAGDSRAIMLSRDEDDDEFMEVTSLNELHSAKNAKERKRVETGFPAIVHNDGYLQPKEGYYRNMQINMTRALGHRVLQNFGVIPDPQVKRLKLTDADQFLVIASDGLWENLSDAEVRDIVVYHKNPKHAANALIERISQYDQSATDVDNVTIIVVAFEVISGKIVATAVANPVAPPSAPIAIPAPPPPPALRKSSKAASTRKGSSPEDVKPSRKSSSPEETKVGSPTKDKKKKPK